MDLRGLGHSPENRKAQITCWLPEAGHIRAGTSGKQRARAVTKGTVNGLRPGHAQLDPLDLDEGISPDAS